ncbi:hypothetical protein Dda_1627 [Drechslerella dactyloides]|uniref:Uncharacterized protein n=1 Tax=Drechslerella dactyloides TaxID=74499 RepID=A0AAD6J220_DREDA|nr:hypothetical protein Dda_1627 [Drechslerella dactyloides]
MTMTLECNHTPDSVGRHVDNAGTGRLKWGVCASFDFPNVAPAGLPPASRNAIQDLHW